MHSHLLTSLAVLCLFGVLAAEPPLPAAPKGDTAESLTTLLAKRVTIDNAFDGTLREVLDHLAEKYDFTFLFDRKAEVGPPPPQAKATPPVARFILLHFRAAEDSLAAAQVKLPKVRNLRLGTILAHVLAQADAAYLVYPDHLKITTKVRALYETGLKTPSRENNGVESELELLAADQIPEALPLTQRALVNLAGDRLRPLNDVLAEIATNTGANIVVSPLLRDKVTVGVKQRLTNVPVETAVRTLCEMADLRVVSEANVLIVVSPERCEAIQKEKARRQHDLAKTEATKLLAQFNPLGGGGQPGVVMPNEQQRHQELTQQLQALQEQVKALTETLKKTPAK